MTSYFKEFKQKQETRDEARAWFRKNERKVVLAEFGKGARQRLMNQGMNPAIADNNREKISVGRPQGEDVFEEVRVTGPQAFYHNLEK